MEINAITNQFVPEALSPAQNELPDEPENDVAPQVTPEAEKQKLRGENGVLRLLQEGHFKPNAEMRLREIFHRELEILGSMNPTEPSEDAAPEELEE